MSRMVVRWCLPYEIPGFQLVYPFGRCYGYSLYMSILYHHFRQCHVWWGLLVRPCGTTCFSEERSRGSWRAARFLWEKPTVEISTNSRIWWFLYFLLMFCIIFGDFPRGVGYNRFFMICLARLQSTVITLLEMAALHQKSSGVLGHFSKGVGFFNYTNLPKKCF